MLVEVYHFDTSVLLELHTHRILFNPCQATISASINWKGVDIIMLSSYNNITLLPYITEYTAFCGRVFATGPTVEFGKLIITEYLRVGAVELGQSYTLYDVDECLQKIEQIHYHSLQKIDQDFDILGYCNGMALGGTNWMIRCGTLEYVYVDTWMNEIHRYVRKMEVNLIRRKDLLIIPTPKTVKRIRWNKTLLDIFPTMEILIKRKGDIIIPVRLFDELFEVIENISSLLESSSMQYPIHILSRTARAAILQSSICSEWMNDEKQEIALNAKNPLKCAELLLKRSLLIHDSQEAFFRYEGPRIVILTKDFNLLDLFSRCNDAIVVIADVDLKVPEAKVYYYDEVVPPRDLKSLLTLLAPKDFILDEDEREMDKGLECFLPNSILNHKVSKDGLIPITNVCFSRNGNRLLKDSELYIQDSP